MEKELKIIQKHMANMYCMTLGLRKEIEKQNNPSSKIKDLEDLDQAREVAVWDDSRSQYMSKPKLKDIAKACRILRRLGKEYDFDSELRKYNQHWNLVYSKGFQSP